MPKVAMSADGSSVSVHTDTSIDGDGNGVLVSPVVGVAT